jgi:hypothetical protein
MHDYGHYCSLSWSLPVFCQPSFVLRGNTYRASNYQKPSYFKESTINSYAWYLQAIPSKISCATFQKKPSKYFSFCGTVFSSWGRSVRICYLPYYNLSKSKKREKKKRKKALFHTIIFQKASPFFYIHITVYFLQASFTFLQTNIFYHTIRLILCLQQTGEIDNLTASWGKVLWLRCVQVPCCRWRRASPR